LNFYLGELEMTRLELIAEICKRMANDLKEDNDKAEAKELSDREDFTYDPHIIKLAQDEQ
jgi:hypothetical protein